MAADTPSSPACPPHGPPAVTRGPDAALPRRSFGSLRTISALMLREMSTRYGRSPGGYVWAVIEPMGAILLLSFGFSLLVTAPSLGNNFILFYASGYLTFNMYQQLSLTVARSIQFSKPLLFYPAVTWIDAVLARSILNTLTSTMVSGIILVAILSLLETRTTIDIGPVIFSLFLAMLLGIGVGVMNCALLGLYPAWDLVWSIVTKPLFLASAIFYIYEDMPQVVQNVLWYNPLVHISGIMRSGIYPTYVPEYVSLPFVLASALTTMVLGLMLLYRHNRAILEN